MEQNTIDLTQPPDQRWQLSDKLALQAQKLTTSFLEDLGGSHQFDGLTEQYIETLDQELVAEMQSIADHINASLVDLTIVNLYYDALKVVLGCTAFAVDTPNGPLHARNLDWWSPEGILSDYSLVTDYQNGPNGDFSIVGWPGYVGALSGVAPGRFAITLNAVLSDEPFELSQPITFLLRTVFTEARTFDEAVSRLAKEPICSDCLLLVTGTEPGEMAVVERTPNRSAIRRPSNGYLVVANEYLSLTSTTSSTSELLFSSPGRYQSTENCLSDQRPQTPEECFVVLSDPNVQMELTVQQMVFSPKTGTIKTKIPNT